MSRYTFLLPAYKAKYLPEALESIKGQSYKDFKVIVSDDCSPEDIKGAFDRCVGDDSRFSYRRNERNMGGKSLVSHWNLLTDLCETEFLILASDDDIYDRTFLESIDLLVNKYPQTDIFRGRVRRINEHGNSFAEEGETDEYLSLMGFTHRSYAKDFIACVSNYCYRTETLKQNNGFIDFPSAWFSDDATNILMSQNGCVTTKDTVFSFRSSELNISSQWGNAEDCKKKIQATLSFYTWMKAFLYKYAEDPLYATVSTEWRHKVYTNIQNHIYHCPLTFLLTNVWRIPNDIGLSKARVIAHWTNNSIRKKI